jgi:HAD superfamily hydrolase (TIGR01509 family)
MKPLLVIFDLDGVLVDSSPVHAAAFDALYDALGIAGPAYDDIAGRPTRSVVRELLGTDAASASVDRWVAFKQDAARRQLDSADIVFADAAATLARLRERGIPLAIGTSASRETAHAVLHAAGWDGWFDAVVTAEDVAAGKPDPEVYLRAMQLAGGSPVRTLIVEDSRAGLESALASGAWAVSVRTGIAAQHARFVGALESLDPLLDLVQPEAAWTMSS